MISPVSLEIERECVVALSLDFKLKVKSLSGLIYVIESKKFTVNTRKMSSGTTYSRYIS